MPQETDYTWFIEPETSSIFNSVAYQVGKKLKQTGFSRSFLCDPFDRLYVRQEIDNSQTKVRLSPFGHRIAIVHARNENGLHQTLIEDLRKLNSK